MSFIEVADGVFIPKKEHAAETLTLPPGVYTIGVSLELGYYVQRTTDFTLPEKIYGDNTHLVETIHNRFLSKRYGKVTTAVLSGLKGSGKTLAAKQLSVKALNEDGICTFLVSNEFSGQGFNDFLTSLQQNQGKPIIVLIDEFEKLYRDQDSINKLLTLLDGTATLHMCVLLTMNTSLEEKRFEFFKNRPGRAYFYKHFETCPENVIRDYCADNLLYPEKLEEIVGFTYRFEAFTLDLLTTLVTEVNLTHGKVALDDICVYINIKPDRQENSLNYQVEYFNLETGEKHNILPVATLGYNATTDILQYDPASISGVYLKDDPGFQAIHEMYLDADGNTEASQRVMISENGAYIESQYQRVPIATEATGKKGKGEDVKYERVFTGYYVSARVGIQQPDVDEEPSVDYIGEVDYTKRQITFKLPMFNLAILVKSLNRRDSKVKRLIL